MIPPLFDYVAPKTLSETVAILGQNEDAKVLASGQGLIPLMGLRLAGPTLHPIRAKGVGESATVGAPAANAVADALWYLGVRNIDIPLTPRKIWEVPNEHGATLEE
jgi:hypothetical protein